MPEPSDGPAVFSEEQTNFHVTDKSGRGSRLRGLFGAISGIDPLMNICELCKESPKAPRWVGNSRPTSDGCNRTSRVCFTSSLSRRTHSNAGRTLQVKSELVWPHFLHSLILRMNPTDETSHLPSGVTVPLTRDLTDPRLIKRDFRRSCPGLLCVEQWWETGGIRIKVEERMYLFKNTFYIVYIFSTLLRLLCL